MFVKIADSTVECELYDTVINIIIVLVTVFFIPIHVLMPSPGLYMLLLWHGLLQNST